MGKSGRSEINRAGIKVVLVVLAISTALAFILLGNFKTSEKYISASTVKFQERGGDLTAEGCVDEVLAWSVECKAIKQICKESVGLMMMSCLKAQERNEYCAEVLPVAADTHFGRKHCKERGYSRRHKACATAYGTIDIYCREVVKGK